MDAAMLFFGLVWALLGGLGSSSSTPPRRQLPQGPRARRAGPPPPWPQVVPAGLPPFPGSGWEFDEPPPPPVQQRAMQLLSQLWARGAGTHKTEQTAGRWITYQAQIVRSGKRGVVAYRERKPAALPPSSPRAPYPRATRRPTAPAVPAASSSAPPPAPQWLPPNASSPVALPTLRYGAGLQPKEPLPEVRIAQDKLGIAADGRFGRGTEAAVRAYQSAHGLKADGIIGPKTWASLFAVRA
jgi:peptidoglycan hydrolase-like protein with peptidoglycan-binding domain